MIQRIGVVYQDAYSLGLLKGLQARLKCLADIVPAPGTVGRGQHMTAYQAKQACLFFKAKAVDVIIRFTDADGGRWQEVRRDELAVFSSDVRSQLVCGVAVNNTEEWLCAAPDYLAGVLGIDAADIRSTPDQSSLVKHAIARSRLGTETVSDVVQRLVTQAPPDAFKRWLCVESFGDFYADCRRLASLFNCETRKEL